MFKISTVYNQHTAKYKGVNVLEPINEQEVLNLLLMQINPCTYMSKLQMAHTLTISTNAFLTQVPFKKYTSHI